MSDQSITVRNFKISPNWDCGVTFEGLIEQSKFVFSNDGHKGKRPRIVLVSPIDGVDCIEIDYDRYGLTTNSVTNFNESWGQSIVDSSKDVIGFISDFLKSEGVLEELTIKETVS